VFPLTKRHYALLFNVRKVVIFFLEKFQFGCYIFAKEVLRRGDISPNEIDNISSQIQCQMTNLKNHLFFSVSAVKKKRDT
jgi:hypothetical protein